MPRAISFMKKSLSPLVIGLFLALSSLFLLLCAIVIVSQDVVSGTMFIVMSSSLSLASRMCAVIVSISSDFIIVKNIYGKKAIDISTIKSLSFTEHVLWIDTTYIHIETKNVLSYCGGVFPLGNAIELINDIPNISRVNSRYYKYKFVLINDKAKQA